MFYAFLVAAGLVVGQPAKAQAPVSWAPDKQFSADESVTAKNGMNITGKVNVDNGKIRSAISMSGMDMVAIIRPDLKKMFTVMEAQKMVMEVALSPEKLKQYTALTAGSDAKFDLVGPEVVGTTPCLKYKMTADKSLSPDKTEKVFFWWVDAATKAPVKVAADDGSIVVQMSNYKAGPQDAALFEPPTTGYQTMQMPDPTAGTPPPMPASSAPATPATPPPAAPVKP